MRVNDSASAAILRPSSLDRVMSARPEQVARCTSFAGPYFSFLATNPRCRATTECIKAERAHAGAWSVFTNELHIRMPQKEYKLSIESIVARLAVLAKKASRLRLRSSRLEEDLDYFAADLDDLMSSIGHPATS